MLKLPAFGRALLDARRRGLRPGPPFEQVWVTDNWDLARRLQGVGYFALVVCPAQAPFDFTLLQDLEVVALIESEDRLGLAERIARVQPRRFCMPERAEWVRWLWRAEDSLPRAELAGLAPLGQDGAPPRRRSHARVCA